MLSVADAEAIVLEHARLLPPVSVPLTAETLGQVLAEEIASDLDMPPYDKALMDGFAVRAADVCDGRATLAVIDEVTAGQTPRRPVGPGQATRIMTGAPIPPGADAVVMVERTQPAGDGQVRIDDKPPEPGQNILPRGREMRRGDVVLSAGTVLRPQELGLLAGVGRTSALLHPRPEVAVLSTGDELVEAGQVPGPGQIRNGNGPMLLAHVQRAGGRPRSLGIARDTVESLHALLAEGLRASVLVLSGGVSAGKLDLVPDGLRALGVEAHFHKVAMKPGKPVFFGTRGSTLVFGLPGNPVSTLVCFELFVRPALRRLLGLAPGPNLVIAALARDFPYHSDRPTYYPVRMELTESGWRVDPVPWFGSPDLRGLLPANAFAVFPAGEHHHRAGDRFPVLKVED
jgi:molybdopterin molybdotransferase